MKNLMILLSLVTLFFEGINTVNAQNNKPVAGLEYHILSPPVGFLSMSQDGSSLYHVSSQENRLGNHVALWKFTDAGGGYYFIQNTATGKYIANGLATQNNSRLFGTNNPGEGAKWKFESHGTSRIRFYLVNKHSNLKVDGESQSNGGPTYVFIPRTEEYYKGPGSSGNRYTINYDGKQLSWDHSSNMDADSDCCSTPDEASNIIGHRWDAIFQMVCRNHDIAYSAPWEVAGIPDGKKVSDDLMLEQNLFVCNNMVSENGFKVDCRTAARTYRTFLNNKWGRDAYEKGQGEASNSFNDGNITMVNPVINQNQDYVIRLKNSLRAQVLQFQVEYTAYNGSRITTYPSPNIPITEVREVKVPHGARNLVVQIYTIVRPNNIIGGGYSVDAQSGTYTLDGTVHNPSFN